jgi:hypothetical protein
MDIMDMVTETNPDAKHIVENVDFENRHPQDYARICKRLGEPERINAKDMSASSRTRLFWHNLGPGNGAERVPLDANRFLQGAGRLKGGRTTAHASWQTGNASTERAGTTDRCDACTQKSTGNGTTWPPTHR